MRRSYGGQGIREVLIGAIVAAATVVLPTPVGTQPMASAAPGDGALTVRVVQEVNANGVVDSTIMEPPLAGVVVHLSDASGASIQATTDDTGVAVFDLAASGLAGGQYRIEADNPRPDFFYPAHAANGQSVEAEPVTAADLESPTNAKLSSTVEFVDVTGDTDVFVNMAFWYPPYYCQENPTLCTAVQPWGAEPGTISGPDEKTLTSAPYQFNLDDQGLATNVDTGTVYGIAYDRDNERIFSAAYAKRGAPYGPGGPGAIYVTDLAAGNTYPLTGTTSQFATIANAGVDNHDMDVNHDYDFFDHVGKESLGDIDITNDNRYLFGVNMFDKTVFVFDLADDSLAGTYAIPNPGCGDDWRPMGTGMGLDTDYVGGVCSGQTNQDMAELTAHVYEFDPATGTFGSMVVSQPLTYDRGIAYKGGTCDGTVEDETVGRWFSWIDGYPSVANEQRAAGCDYAGWIGYPTPMLGDVIEETNGDLVISFRDRFADQVGFNAAEERANGTFATIGEPGAGGDVVRGCKLADGTFVLDPNLLPADVLASTALCTDNNDGAGDGGQDTSFREFYSGDWRTGFHEESFYGGIALARSEPSITGTGFDSTGAVWTQGIGAIDRGGELPSGALGVRTDDGTSDRFGKGAGMADLEVLCDEAPIQVGNRVWLDIDGDGTQDPGETPVEGVTVNIYDATGTTLIGTTTTSASGEYYFDDTNVANGLLEGTDYVIRLDEPADYETGGPLDGSVPTVQGAGGNPELDSDGVIGGSGFPETDITTGGPGVNDHSVDFGFVSPSVSVGDFVWVDTDRDGQQDAGEPGIEGVTLTLTGPDGQPVVDVFGNPVGPVQTDANGEYSFDNLPVLESGESYTVTIDETSPALDPYIPTVANTGDPASDSSTGSATSGDLTADGDRDSTLDFGFVPDSVSVGDFVWVDTDRDGQQDAGEPGIEGVTLTLTGPDGQPVVDVFGNPVGPVQTDANGEYSFDNLPVLESGESYTVTIDETSPALDPYIPTVANTGDPASDSSTGSATSGDLTADGDRDSTLDFGFVSPSVSVGDFVWVDTDRDGQQDAGEPGIEGVTLTLTDSNGDPVVDVFGNPVGPVVTDANGKYVFDGLPALAPGESYTVTVTPPDGYQPTTPGQGGPASDSSTGSASSGDLTVDGAHDPTLDFG
ncbi:MAG: hypothetical protein KDB37_00830, partial [Ilumatobacter sp.]|nr:hypothetical protein [Ilumatobacter sp.]